MVGEMAINNVSTPTPCFFLPPCSTPYSRNFGQKLFDKIIQIQCLHESRAVPAHKRFFLHDLFLVFPLAALGDLGVFSHGGKGNKPKEGGTEAERKVRNQFRESKARERKRRKLEDEAAALRAEP